MDEETAIINNNTRKEKIRNFFLNNKKSLIIIFLLIISLLIAFFVYEELRENQRLKISDQYNAAVIEYSLDNKEKTKKSLVDLIYKNDPTYSPLS